MTIYIKLLVAANNIKRDVFETLYLKRPSKSRSSKSSSESFRGVEDMPANYGEKSQFNGNTFRKSKHVPSDYLKEEPPMRSSGTPDSNKSDTKLKKYLFGVSEKPKPAERTVVENGESGAKDDRFKTVTINSLRRSFRDSFLQSSKPKKEREHQPLWFIDVTKDKELTPKPQPRQFKDEDSDNLYENTKTDRKTSISRKETFRVDEKPTKYSNTSLTRKETFRVDEKPTKYSGSLGRKETFRIDDSSRSPTTHSLERRKQSYEPVRVEIISPKSDRSGKLVPVAITAPYSALNDVQEKTKLANGFSAADDHTDYTPRHNYSPERSPTRKKFSHVPSSTVYVPHRDSIRSDDEQPRGNVSPSKYGNSYDKTEADDESRTSRNHLNDSLDGERSSARPQFTNIRNLDSLYLPNDYGPNVNRTVISVGPQADRSRYSAYRDASPKRDPYYSSFRSQNDEFDRRQETYSRRSLKDIRSNPDDSPSKPSFRMSSLRSVFDRKPSNDYRDVYKAGRGYRESDEVDRKYNDLDDRKSNWAHQSWRNISTRPFTTREDIDPNNRSFVPYYNYDKDRYPEQDDRLPKKDNNRTTININYNYNANHSPLTAAGNYSTNPYERSKRNQIDPSPTRRNPSALTSMPSLKSSRDKSNGNKNRSVNFPSVEYEVRLISPNYESTPRRRVKPTGTTSAADWTFNKVHV